MSTRPHTRPRPDAGPTKDVVVLDTSGHRPMFEQPDEFVAYLTDVVLPATTAGAPSP